MVAFLLILVVLAAAIGAGVYLYLNRAAGLAMGRVAAIVAAIVIALVVVIPLLWRVMDGDLRGTVAGGLRFLLWLALSGLVIWGSCQVPGLRWYIRAWLVVLVPLWLAAFLCLGPAREPLIRVAFAFTWILPAFPIVYGIWRASAPGHRVFLIGMCMLVIYWWWATLLFDLDRSVRLLTEPSPKPAMRITKPPARPASSPTTRPRPESSPVAAPAPVPSPTRRWTPAPRPTTPRPAPRPTQDPNRVLDSTSVP